MKISLLAKSPVAGFAKTRLIGPLTPTQAAATHAAMVHCTIQRVTTALGDRAEHELVLALDHHCGPSLGSVERDGWLGEAAAGWEVIDQGPGDLGARLDRIWQEGSRGPTVFLGCDCPDVPFDILRSIPEALRQADVCLGPTHDGGYWTLGSKQPHRSLLRGIDWGTSSVYDQTLEAARNGGFRVAILPTWSDVDTINDLSRLRHRLATARENPLATLRRSLDTLLGGFPR